MINAKCMNKQDYHLYEITFNSGIVYEIDITTSAMCLYLVLPERLLHVLDQTLIGYLELLSTAKSIRKIENYLDDTNKENVLESSQKHYEYYLEYFEVHENEDILTELPAIADELSLSPDKAPSEYEFVLRLHDDLEGESIDTDHNLSSIFCFEKHYNSEYFLVMCKLHSLFQFLISKAVWVRQVRAVTTGEHNTIIQEVSERFKETLDEALSLAG